MSLFQTFLKFLKEMAEFKALDIEIADAIWGKSGHTISYHLGKLEEQVPPDEVAVKICDILAKVLGPDHCKKAVIDEGG